MGLFSFLFGCNCKCECDADKEEKEIKKHKQPNGNCPNCHEADLKYHPVSSTKYYYECPKCGYEEWDPSTESFYDKLNWYE